MVIDLIEIRENNLVVGEVKKSSKTEKSAMIQLAYYLYRLRESGVTASGVILFPKEKRRVLVKLSSDLEAELLKTLEAIENVLQKDFPPPVKRIRYCTHCAYGEFCWS